MKTIITMIILMMSMSLEAQTTVYELQKEGTKDPKHYYYFDHNSSKAYKCHNDKGKERIPDILIKIEGNKIYSFIERTEEKILVGEYTSNKKIVRIKQGQRGSEENAPYIKEKKVYSSSGELLGIIEGKEIYGAAAYLMGQFR